ncbi:hypothetical protein [Deinococcus cavernae]|uniref:hypothetical protein n=1 Tax=Deinococcus cavernae TaxID=2320857 RepID=UPI001F334374|nr:hypothetical protein [Deinococcus cavernae]
MNKLNPAFTIHVGDIKSGSTPCSDENFQKVKDEFGLFTGPLIYTPGDNEWTDCHREKAGKFDPLERLNKIRELFSGSGQQQFRQEALTLTRQDKLIENSRWAQDGVIFGTFTWSAATTAWNANSASVGEYFTRNAANVEWIKATFAEAKEKNAPAVVMAFQADLFYGAPCC